MSSSPRVRKIETASYWKKISFESTNSYFISRFPELQFMPVSVLTNTTVRAFEAITPNSTGDRKAWKAFEHFSSSTNLASGGLGRVLITADLYSGDPIAKATVCDDTLFNRSTDFGPPGQYNESLDPWYIPRPDGGFIPITVDLESLKKRGLSAMLPKVKAELSSLVSLYEIRDVASIRGSINNLIKLAASISLKGFTRPLAKAAVRATGDGYLQWMFNLKPVVTDICGIYRTVASYERRINDLISRSGKTQTAHFVCNLNESLVPIYEPYGPWKVMSGLSSGICFQDGSPRYLGTDVRIKRTVIPTSAVFRCEMEYNYTFTAFQREHSKLLGVLDMLGVNLNPSYIWNVIPWSFVIDWLVNVSSWLSQFEIKNLEPKVNILRYCWSIKKTRKIGIGAEIRSSVNYASPGLYPTQHMRFPEVYETSYRRGIDLPSTSSFTTSGLSPTELSLGAALLITRRRRNPGRPLVKR